MALKLENINNLISDDLAKRNENWTEIDTKLSEKVQNFKMKNGVVNGDFSQDTTGWSGLYSTVSASANILTTTGLGTSAGPGVRRSEGKRDGCRYYAKAFFRHIGTKTPTFRIAVGGTTAVSQVKQNDDWHEISGIAKIPLDTSDKWYQLASFFSSSSDALGEQVEHKKFIVINLTNEFGAGNEPTKLEMDELMKVIPNGWWDGELTLTQKQFVTWQLNLIRKNTNAIIALGGTII